MKISITEKLGSIKSEFKQVSIDTKIDIISIENLIEKNLNFFENFSLKLNDKYSSELLAKIKSNNFPYSISKHNEKFILNNISNLEKIWKYLVFRYKFFLASTKKINLGYPPYILIEPVSTCNLKCPFCFQSDKSFTKKPYMGVIKKELFMKVAKEANEIGVGAITLGSRGEPTLHKDLSEMLRFLSNLKNIFEIKLNTNATFLTEKISHTLLSNNISQIVISADHYQKKEYEELRLGSNFEKILKNIDNLYSIREKFYKNSCTEIRISAVDAKKSLNREKFKEFWETRCDHVSVGMPLDRWDTYNNEPHPEIIEPCQNLWDRMYIWFDGKVNPCDADYKSFLSYGDVTKKSIKELWNENSIEKLRKLHLNKLRCKANPCDRCGYY